MSTEASTRPLGARPDVILTANQVRVMQVLEEYDLTPVRSRLLRDGAMPAGWVDEALLEFRRYLSLRGLAQYPLTMFSKQVDDVWHTCLLFSRLYAQLCHEAFGRFVHHEPAAGPEPDRAARWREFENVYGCYYGPPGRLWQMGRPAEE
jgi:hypothetical protein